VTFSECRVVVGDEDQTSSSSTRLLLYLFGLVMSVQSSLLLLCFAPFFFPFSFFSLPAAMNVAGECA